jgi:hypothetical protein
LFFHVKFSTILASIVFYDSTDTKGPVAKK